MIIIEKSFGFHTCAFYVTATDKYREKHREVKINTDKCQECPLVKIDCCLDPDSIFNKFIMDFSKLKFHDRSESNLDLLQTIIEDAQIMVSNIEST